MKFKNIFKHKKITITEKDNPEIEWYEEAKKQTVKSLPKFIKHLMNDYDHDYGTICKAIGAASAATAWACNKMDAGHITGFQASAVPWSFMNAWGTLDYEVGAEMRVFDDMLYPQYQKRFEKYIDKDIFKELQKVAKRELEKESERPDDLKHFSERVRIHMQSIVDGIPPFGYSIKD